MTASQVITLIALILVSGGVTTFLFEKLKAWFPTNDALRSALAYILAAVVALAGSWVAGDVLGVIGSWRAGTLDAWQLFAYINGIAAASTALYNAYYKGIKPAIQAGRQSIATLFLTLTGPNSQKLADAFQGSTTVIKTESEASPPKV
jgi:hypothetical protein